MATPTATRRRPEERNDARSTTEKTQSTASSVDVQSLSVKSQLLASLSNPPSPVRSLKSLWPEPPIPSTVALNALPPPVTPNPLLSSSQSFLRSSLKRKRTVVDVEPPASPVKRTVTFNDVVDEAENETTQNDAHKEVVYALESHAEGDSEALEILRGYFSSGDTSDRPSPERLRLYLISLTSNVGMLQRSCSSLVHKILESDWLYQDDAYITAYVRLLRGLVSSRGFWVGEVLRMLVDKFDGRKSTLPPFAPPTAVLQDRLHSALQYILQLVPTASQILGDSSFGRVSLLSSRFPHQNDTRRAHVRYVQNLFRLTEYAPELQGEILTLVTERMVKIDVQVQIDFDDLADEIGDELLSNLPALNEQTLDVEDSDDEDDMSDNEDDTKESKMKAITTSMSTLDAIMALLFEYYAVAFANPSSTAAVSASRILLSHFRNIILPTYRSRHTQFLLFHFMQCSPALVDEFLGTCVSLVLERSRPRILRQSAATYLASFVARGLQVSREMTRDVFAFVAEQLTALRSYYEPTCLGPNPQKYDTYYALVQALLYIFCFRWRDLAIHDDEQSNLSPPQLPGNNMVGIEEDWEIAQFPSDVKEALTSNVFSPLNPLRLVAPAIAAEFVDSARKLRVLYAHHVLATNQRVRILTSGTSYSGEARLVSMASRGGSAVSTPLESSGIDTPTIGGADPLAAQNREISSAHALRRDDARACLDGYFPFDPYRLPASKHWVEGTYREWEGLGDDEDEGGSSEEDDEGDDDDMD